jgi:hypothetical protein
MRRLRTPALFAVVLAIALAFAASSSRPALAVGSQIRTFVASTGSDANPCSRVAPCRTFGAALAQTASGGEIVALDSGGYGAVTINQAVTIAAAPGVQASISPSSGSAIAVNAGSTDAIVLRNLNLNGLGASYGIYYTAGQSLSVENVVVNGFTGDGILVSLSTTGTFSMTDSIVQNSAGGIGVYLATSAGTLTALLERVRIERSFFGLIASSGSKVTARDVSALGNTSSGFQNQTPTGALSSQLDLEHCVATGNGFGVANVAGSGSPAITRVSNCTITANTYGLSGVSVGGSLLSRGNNTVEGNTTDGVFSGSYAAK